MLSTQFVAPAGVKYTLLFAIITPPWILEKMGNQLLSSILTSRQKFKQVTEITKMKIYRQFIKHASLMPLKCSRETNHFFRKVADIKELSTHRMSPRWVGQIIVVISFLC